MAVCGSINLLSLVIIMSNEESERVHSISVITVNSKPKKIKFFWILEQQYENILRKNNRRSKCVRLLDHQKGLLVVQNECTHFSVELFNSEKDLLKATTALHRVRSLECSLLKYSLNA